MNNKLTLRDVITVALLGLVGFILSMVGGMLTSVFGTYAMFVHSSLGSFLTGPVFITMVKRLRKRGVALIYYGISAIIYLIMGMAPMAPILLASGIISELIIGGYNNDKRINLSFVGGELIQAMHGFILLLVFGAKGLAEQFPTMFTEEAAVRIQGIYFNPRNVIIIVIVQLLLSSLGVVFGNYVYRRFFDQDRKSKEILS